MCDFVAFFNGTKVLSLLEACLDLISSPFPSMKIQIMDGKRENYWKSGVWIPAPVGQIFFRPFSVHFQILHKKLHKDWRLKKLTTFAFGQFMTISGHFIANYINIFHKSVVLTVILRGLTTLNLNLIKSYDLNSNYFCQLCFLILEEKIWRLKFQRWHFFHHLWSVFLATK